MLHVANKDLRRATFDIWIIYCSFVSTSHEWYSICETLRQIYMIIYIWFIWQRYINIYYMNTSFPNTTYDLTWSHHPLIGRARHSPSSPTPQIRWCGSSFKIVYDHGPTFGNCLPAPSIMDTNNGSRPWGQQTWLSNRGGDGVLVFSCEENEPYYVRSPCR
jgi:hypothetical protein